MPNSVMAEWYPSRPEGRHSLMGTLPALCRSVWILP